MKKVKVLITALSILVTMAVLFAAMPVVPASAEAVTLMDENFNGPDFDLAAFQAKYPISGMTGSYSTAIEEDAGEDDTDCLNAINMETYSNSMMLRIDLGFDPSGIAWRSNDVTLTFDMKVDRYWDAWDEGVRIKHDEARGSGKLVPWISSEGYNFDAYSVIIEEITENNIEFFEWQQMSITFNVADLLPSRATSGYVSLLFKVEAGGGTLEGQLFDNMRATYSSDPGDPGDPDPGDPGDPGDIEYLYEEDFDDKTAVPADFNTTWGANNKIALVEEGQTGSNCLRYTTTENTRHFLILKLDALDGISGAWRERDITISFDMQSQREDGTEWGTGFSPELANQMAYNDALTILDTPIGSEPNEWKKMEITFNVADLYPAAYEDSWGLQFVFGMDMDMAGWDHTTIWIDNVKIFYTPEAPPVAAPKISLLDGAELRLTSPTGMRFSSVMSFEDYNKFAEADEFEFGTLICPTDFLTPGVEFTIDGLTGASKIFLNIKQTVWAKTAKQPGEFYQMNAVITNINPTNYGRDFSARSYVKLTNGGVSEYIYADYDPAVNSRSTSYVASKALEAGGYSPEEIAILESFIVD